MKILITGHTAAHIQSSRVRMTVVTCVYPLKDALLSLGCQVEHRKIIPGESLDSFDKVIVFMGSHDSNPNKYAYGALWTLYKRPDAYIAFDDWRVNTYINSYNRLKGNYDKLWNPAISKIDRDAWMLYKDEIIKGAKILENIQKSKNKILLPTFDFGTNNEFNLPLHNIIRFDPSSFVHKIFFNKSNDRKFRWVLASLGDRSKYLKSVSPTWEVIKFDNKENPLIKEEEIVQKYAENWGILSPEYDIAQTGWWRNRVLHSMWTQSILLTSKREGAVMGGPFEFDYVKNIELDSSRVTDLAEEQNLWIKSKIWNKDRFIQWIKNEFGIKEKQINQTIDVGLF